MGIYVPKEHKKTIALGALIFVMVLYLLYRHYKEGDDEHELEDKTTYGGGRGGGRKRRTRKRHSKRHSK